MLPIRSQSSLKPSEAKADELFGSTIAKTLADAVERKLANPHSRGIQRVEELIQSLFSPRQKGYPHVAGLRYQLLTAAGGTLAYATKENASIAVLILHEFVTEETNDENLTRNDSDYLNFLHRLGEAQTSASDTAVLRGPFSFPSGPLFDQVIPFLLVRSEQTADHEVLNHIMTMSQSVRLAALQTRSLLLRV